MGLTKQESVELARLEAAFEEAGGRGVELADRIDELRAKRDGGDSMSVADLLEALREAPQDALVYVENDELTTVSIGPKGTAVFLWSDTQEEEQA